VAENPNAIGYVSTNFIDKRVYAIPIEDASPTPENIAAGRYSLIRDLSLITSTNSKKEVEQFIQFVFSPAGQEIIKAFTSS
jgi:phosphate transport system substrate-binding protein